MSARSFLECPICIEKFNQTDRCPRIAGPCGHSVCEACVTAVIGDNGHMTCPTCRSKVDTPQGVSRSPTFFQFFCLTVFSMFDLCHALQSLDQFAYLDIKCCCIYLRPIAWRRTTSFWTVWLNPTRERRSLISAKRATRLTTPPTSV